MERTLAYIFLIFVLAVLIGIYSNLGYVEKRMEYPHAKFCSNGVVFDQHMERKVIGYSNAYITHFVGNNYFNNHFYFLNYTFNDCTVVLNYRYIVSNITENVYVKVYLPNQATVIVRDSNVPKYPFEINYGPSDFHINYTSYEVNYDPEIGFTYRFFYNKVPVGVGNAQTGEFERIFSTL